MQDRLICIVGASGSGKTTIAKELEKMGYNIIMSYTTREPREENEWRHKFTDCLSDDFTILDCIDNEVIPGENVIAYKEVYKDCHYWATKEQYQGKGTSIYVIDPGGAEQVRNNVKDADVVTIFLSVDEITRSFRMAKRSNIDAFEHMMYPDEEIIGRIEDDKEIFKLCKCDYVIDANRELEEVLEDVVRIIEGVK